MNARRIQQLAAAFLIGMTLAAWMKAPQAKEDPKARLAKAEAMFAERCKKSGEFIHRTAQNVEGIFLMKIRPKEINYGDQFKMDDPYGRDFGEEAYIRSFLRGFFEVNYRRPDVPRPNAPPHVAYRYVEAVDAKDGKRYRYTGRIDQPSLRDKRYGEWVREFVLDKVPAPGASLRYGVTYDDISTRDEREYWIAGSSLKVMDLHTNEVMAERIGYMMDRGQGNNSGGRSPWLLAAEHACPTFQRNPLRPLQAGHGASAQQLQTEDFVEKVLKPVPEN